MRCLWLLLLITSQPAHADNDSFPFVSVGGLIGSGPAFGVEISGGWFGTIANDSDDGPKGRDGFHLQPPFWIGGYADVVYNGSTETGHLSFGPEIGLLVFGLDGVEKWNDADESDVEVGLLVKYAFKP